MCEITVQSSTADCYEAQYNSRTKFTENIVEDIDTYPWAVYKSESETGISRTINGDFSSYDGSGYVVDFDPMKTAYDWEDQMDELFNNGMFDKSTRSLIITFTIFSPSISMWVSCEFMYEFSVVGLVNPSFMIVRPFRPNILETSHEEGLWATEFFRLFLTVYILAVLVVKRVIQMKSLTKLFSFDVLYTLISDIAIVALSVTIFALVLVLSSKSTQSCIDNTTFTDFVLKAYWYNVIFILESFLLFFIVSKLLAIFAVSQNLTVIRMSFNIAIKQLISYAIIIFPILSCMAIICMQIWGPFSTDYKTFAHSFISIIYLILGKGDAYITISVFVAVYAYSYGLTLLSQGYPDGEWNLSKVRGISHYMYRSNLKLLPDGSLGSCPTVSSKEYAPTIKPF